MTSHAIWHIFVCLGILVSYFSYVNFFFLLIMFCIVPLYWVIPLL
jgi:hypothetical protein